MPALIEITDNTPTGWITAPDMATLFNLAQGSDMCNNSDLMNQLYSMRDSIYSTEHRRELEPGVWLLLD